MWLALVGCAPDAQDTARDTPRGVLGVRGPLPLAFEAHDPETVPVPPAFTEVAAAAGVAVRHANGEDEMAGGAAADFDRDGWVDLFVLGGGGEPDRLFLNNGDGTFRDEAPAWGVAATHAGRAVAAADLDADGWIDLYVTSGGDPAAPAPGMHRLYRNTGAGFEERAAAAGVAHTASFGPDGNGVATGDYDGDGDVDLFVAGAELAFDGNHLFRNDGGLVFTDVTAAAGLLSDDARFRNAGFSARFADLDGDLAPELLLVADFGNSRYFRNLGDGTFSDDSAASGTGRDENGMGSAVADLDGDGLLDWYVTSIYNGTHWTGNKLYRNLGAHRFEEVAEARGIADGGWGWGVVAADLNHDGFLDLFTVNGARYGQYAEEPPCLWMGGPDATFSDATEAAGLGAPSEGRGLLDLDYDGDGDRDLVVFQNNDALQLWRNDVAGDHARWLVVRLDTAGSGLPPDGLGARVTATRGDRVWLRYAATGDTYRSHSEPTVHIGLGAARGVDALEVAWPDGRVTTLRDLAANQVVTVRP